MSTSTEIATTTGAVATQPSSELAIAPGQTEFTPAQVAALAQLGVQDASPGDLQVFFHQAKSIGLDPFKRQIYMIGRKTKTGGYRGEPERWETKWTIQIGIDGYRLGARRVVNALGIRLESDGPYWHDGNGWVDVWLNPNQPPAAAKFTIIRDGEKHTATANFAEYVQTKSNGDPNAMWSKMPATMLAKCAEAAAHRRAFPDTFSGVVFEDAAHTVVDSTVVEDPAPTKAGARGTAGLASALGVMAEVVTEDIVDAQTEPAATTESEDSPSKAQITKLNALLKRGGLTAQDKAGRKIVVDSFLPDRGPDHAPTAEQIDHVITQLEAAGDDAALTAVVESIITEHDQAQS